MGRELLSLLRCDRDNLGCQTLQSALDFLVGKLLDPLLFRDFQLLLGVDFALACIAESVLKQELRTLGVAFCLEETL